MSGNPLLKRLLDAGLQFTEMSREQADKLVKEFVRNGQAKRKDRELLVEQLLERGRAVSEGVAAVIQREIGKHLATVVARLDDVEDRVEELAGRLGSAVVRGGKQPSSPSGAPSPASAAARDSASAKQASTSPAGKQSASKKKASKKSATKKSTGKKSATKKSAGKKKAAGKKSAVKQSASTTAAPAKQAKVTSAPTAPATSAPGAGQA